MKKILALLLVVAMLLPMLCGCNIRLPFELPFDLPFDGPGMAATTAPTEGNICLAELPKTPADPLQLSGVVQAAYHWWELFFYDGVPIPYPEQAAASILRTQNPLGGFGLGVHNRKEPFHSSACEDIDSMSPLARLYRLGIVKNDTVKEALLKGAQWVKSNQTPDGGLQFIKNRRFDYGHPQLAGPEDSGAMFPTWFRSLTLALTASAFGDESLHFVRCPGMQFDVG